MLYNKDNIHDLLQYGEHTTLECKLAEKGLPKSVWETYSAFANSKGGDIILGIEEIKDSENNSQYNIVGVKHQASIIKDFWNTINSEKVNNNILQDDNVQIIKIDDFDIILIHVPRATYLQRPIYINGNIYKGTFKRNNEGDYHCSEQDVKTMLRDSNDSGNDGILLEHYDMNDIDPITLRSYRNEFAVKNPDHVWNGLDNKEFLQNLGGFVRDRDNNKEGLSIAGLLMFGKGLPIRERFDNIRMDYLDKQNLSPDVRWNDRLTYDGLWENNLYNFFKAVVQKLSNGLQHPFRLDGISRTDDTSINKAIREAVTNMIIHSDYYVTGVLKVEKLDDGFLLTNPGNLRLPIEAIYEGGNSKARNPRLQNMMRMIGYGDNIGSGFPTILKAWKEENWRKPSLIENIDLQQVELKLWLVSLISGETNIALHTIFGTEYDKLSANEQIILSIAHSDREITNSQLQPLLNENSLVVGKILCQLVNNGFLIPKNLGRWTTYHICTDRKVTKQKVTKQKVTKQKVTKQILDFCHTPKSLSEIANNIGYKHLSNLRKNYINPMLENGMIKMTHPENPRHEDQKYVTEQQLSLYFLE